VRGFTLLEVLVVLAVVAAMASLALFASGPTVERFRQREALELAAQLVTEAQVRARATGRCHRVVVHLAGAVTPAGRPGDALALEVRPDADCAAPPDEVTWRRLAYEPLPAGVQGFNVDDGRFTWTEVQPNGRLRQAPSGQAPSGGLAFAISAVPDALLVTAPQGVTCLTGRSAPEPCP
jgi:prepilin-type N-terminal cleavage/methylation domain-containing protein